MYDIVISIVAFNTDMDILKRVLECSSNSFLKIHVFVIDNSSLDKLRSVCSGKNVEYIFNRNNLGFGAAHNIAIRKMDGKTKYLLILNPDIYFHEGTLEKLFNFMEENSGVGLVMPRVLYPDGSQQYLCRLLPSPFEMMAKKINFKFLNPLFNPGKFRHELRFTGYDKTMDVPYLSGCFMFIRHNIFEKVGAFDERFFVHFEDLDLSRRIHRLYRTVYYPQAIAYHEYERTSDKDLRIFGYLVSSGIKYFNKWGWFFDRERKIINNRVIKNIQLSR